MHDSKLGAQTWLLALFLIVSNPKGRSSVQLAADLGITQKSARHVGHRIREALADGSLPGFEGPVEVDETFIGGKAKNMHAAKRHQRHADRHRLRDDPARLDGVHRRRPRLRPAQEMGYLHAKVMHSVGEYVRGPVSTNGIENFWSGSKRTYIGTYHYWSDDHLHRYVDEHSFRYNQRSRHVTDRMRDAAQAMNGRRLPWRELVGA